MFLADYHLHTLDNSFDGRYTMAQMASAAASRGISQLCFTDHVDIDRSWESGVRFDKWCFIMYEPMCEEFCETKKLPGLPELRLGVELGAANHYPDFAATLTAKPGLDFVIGSVHNLRDQTDFSFLPYDDPASFPTLLEAYAGEILEVAETRLCDVIGHIGYPQRYMAKRGHDCSGFFSEDLYRPVFCRLAELGVGIEVNTSGLRDVIGHTLPPLSLLRLYRRCGGEIVTCGSDAHRIEDVGCGIGEAYDLLRQAGFRYVTTFRGRSPEFQKLD